jgi:hypothetical protein
MAESYFQIKRPSPNEATSLIIYEQRKRGVAISHDQSTPTIGIPCNGRGFIGFLNRPVNDVGPSLESLVFPGVEAESPVPYSHACSLEDALEVEAEGVDFLYDSGNETVNVNTPVGSLLTFRDGQFALYQSGMTPLSTPYFQLTAHLAAEDSGNDTKILAVRI